MKKDTRVTVSILDKEYQVACEPEERDALLAAARTLDSRMRKVRNSGAVVGSDRIAVMVGLNLCYELHQVQQTTGNVSASALEHVVSRLDNALKQP